MRVTESLRWCAAALPRLAPKVVNGVDVATLGRIYSGATDEGGLASFTFINVKRESLPNFLMGRADLQLE